MRKPIRIFCHWTHMSLTCDSSSSAKLIIERTVNSRSLESTVQLPSSIAKGFAWWKQSTCQGQRSDLRSINAPPTSSNTRSPTHLAVEIWATGQGHRSEIDTPVSNLKPLGVYFNDDHDTLKPSNRGAPDSCGWIGYRLSNYKERQSPY